VHLLGVIFVLALFGQFHGLNLLFLVSLRSYGGGKALKWWLCMSIVMYFSKNVGNVASEQF
jgi:hypothetical protein